MEGLRLGLFFSSTLVLGWWFALVGNIFIISTTNKMFVASLYVPLPSITALNEPLDGLIHNLTHFHIVGYV